MFPIHISLHPVFYIFFHFFINFRFYVATVSKIVFLFDYLYQIILFFSLLPFPSSYLLVFRYSNGVTPYRSLNARLK
ncbi:hypothetical protein SAMN05216521_105522 [Enterocloster clostridioformis]|uniref:Uncharacterized protein n=1 Tax=Enterocloster clostridioformis TaxID=1531 RepID=A0A1I0JFZ9_9FIRM|nr:hypothetical protein SAMN05216521_105522 [Enterocloster clostridioformis]SEW45322.1 hypothetical protein SAMN05216528_105321 [Enterocloster clostridioformis]